MNRRQLASAFRKVQVVRAPKRRLATFGTSRIDYQVITDVAGLPDRSRIRAGVVVAERPKLITPDSLREQFSGFGPDSGKYADTLASHYGEALHGLEYNFRNETVDTRIELSPPDRFVPEFVRRHDSDGVDNAAVLTGSDKLWELSVMKFIVEETLASFVSNVRELKEHGFFDTDDEKLERKHAEVRQLLRRATRDRALVPSLAQKLKHYGLFDQYQDEFFRLVNPS